MKRLIQILLITTVASLSLGYALGLSQSTVLAAAKDDICEGIGLVDGSQDCQPAAEDRSISDVVAIIINVLSVMVGVAAVIMIIIGGFKYVTSSGDSNGVQSAKNTILFAIVGLVIVAIAQTIVKFVVDRTT